jgi:hypothetical protein
MAAVEIAFIGTHAGQSLHIDTPCLAFTPGLNPPATGVPYARASDPKVCALLGKSDAQAYESGATFRSQAIPLARPLR